MFRLERSDVLGRLVRKGEITGLNVSTWSIIRYAIKEGRRNDAIDYLRYLPREVGERVTGHMNFINKSLTYIAENHGEEEVAKALRWYRNVLKEAGRIDMRYSLNLEELIHYQAEALRASLGLGGRRCFAITEEPERFVISVHTHIGRMRLMSQSQGIPFILGVTTEPHHWSWGKSAVPYYCAHCCLWWEIMPIEEHGYPIRVHEFPENPRDPCRIIYFKKAELIPFKYFKQVGMKVPLGFIEAPSNFAD